ncbi:MAG TPA: low specificity L-threonine aldolase [Verrucomicrobiota bacterium]|nr:threonine aldolase [Verrucomicrobiales bacterium]HRI12945.1 low specificity L-threonine aldolase [Verrucomicrobiota bacterium]
MSSSSNSRVLPFSPDPTRQTRRHFASDNYAGIAPEAWAALEEANRGHAPAYGNDPWTQRAADLIRDLFETPCEVFFVFNGTAANSLALAHLCQSYHSVLCHDVAHVEKDECGAPEFFANGSKLLLLSGPNGKLTPAGIEEAVLRRTDVHYPKPRVVSLTQATEVGTVYTPAEVRAIGATAKKHQLRLHMDGARFANAVAALGVAPREITWQAGVDVLCFGGSKNGIHVGEAVVFFNRDLAREFDYRAKQGGQLCSKMRFVAAPWVGMLQDGVWVRHGAHANAMAALMEQLVRVIPGVKILFPREANSVFVDLPKTAIHTLYERGWLFYNFIGEGGCRLMCSWDTAEVDVRSFAADLAQAMPPTASASLTPSPKSRKRALRGRASNLN